jgi:molybdopterin converting factor subunit 1
MSGADTIQLNLLYFAWLRERVGKGAETVEVPRAAATVGGLIAWLSDRSPAHAAAFVNGATIRCAVNQAFADRTAAVADGDEVAFFPPVTGG